jgi:hypothetical protein
MSDMFNIPFKKVSELEAAGSLLGTDTLAIVREGSPSNPLRGLISQLVALVVPDVVPLVLASVGIQEGTITGTSHGGGQTTFTYTSAVETPDFGRLCVIWPETNQGTIVMAREGGATRAAGQANGLAVQPQILVPGRLAVLQRRGNAFRIENLDLIQNFTSQVHLVGASAMIEGRASQGGTVLSRIAGLGEGNMVIQVLVAGAMRNALQVQSNAEVRVLSKLLNPSSEEYFHPGNRPSIYRQIAEAINDVIAPISSRDTDPVRITTPDRYTIGGRDRNLFVSGTAGLVDSSGMFMTQEVGIDVASNASLTLVAPPGVTWRGSGGANQLAIPADSSLRIKRNQQNFEAERRVLFVTAASLTLPAPSLVGFIGGQSYAVDAARHALPGLQDARTICGLPRTVRMIEGTAFGASCFLANVPGKSMNFMWNHNNDTPGPNYAPLLATLLADPDIALLTDVAWQHFLNDMALFLPTGTNTPAALVTAIRSFIARLRTDLGKPNLRFHFCAGPPGQFGSDGVFPDEAWGAIRRAVGDAIRGQPNCWIAPPFYDLALHYENDAIDRHPGFVQQARWGMRFGMHLANVVHGQTRWMGPEIVQFTEVSSTEYAWRVKYDGGKRPQLENNVAGFALLPPGTHLFDAPLPIARQQWGGDGPGHAILRQYLASPVSGARPVYPWGPLEEMQDPSRIMRALSPDGAGWWPLREYLPA